MGIGWWLVRRFSRFCNVFSLFFVVVCFCNNQMGMGMGFVSLEVAILEFSFFSVRFVDEKGKKTGTKGLSLESD